MDEGTLLCFTVALFLFDGLFVCLTDWLFGLFACLLVSFCLPV